MKRIGYKPSPKNIKRPKRPTPAPPPKKEPTCLTMKDIDKLNIYFTDREIAHILWFG